MEYSDFISLQKTYADLCISSNESYPKILINIFGEDKLELLTNIPDYYCDYCIDFGYYITGTACGDCVCLFTEIDEFFSEVLHDAGVNDDLKTYKKNELNSILYDILLSFAHDCDNIKDEIPTLFSAEITNETINELISRVNKLRNTVLSIFKDYVDVKSLIIKSLYDKLSNKEINIKKLQEKLMKRNKVYDDLKKQIKEYENMVHII